MKKIFIFISLFACLSAWAQLTNALNRFAFPALGGKRMYVLNVANGTNDSGNSAAFGVAANMYDQVYMTSTGGVSSAYWNQMLKPSIDAAKAAGANCIRVMGDITAVQGYGASSGNHGAASWLGQVTIQQYQTNYADLICNYCESNNIWVYPCLTDSRVINDANIGTNNVCAFLTVAAGIWSIHNNVIGIDAINELDGVPSGTNNSLGIPNNAGMYIAATKAGLNANHKVPVTISMNGAAFASDLNPSNRWFFTKLANSGIDYFDVHWYYLAGFSDFYPLLTNQWGLPVSYGESGINYNGLWAAGTAQEATHPYSSEIRRDFYARKRGIDQLPYFQVRGLWATTPNWLTNEEDWGLYDGSQSATYAYTNAREHIRDVKIASIQTDPRNSPWLVISNVSTTAANYGGGKTYGVQSAMSDIQGSTWGYSSSAGIQANGNIASLTYADGKLQLINNALPRALGQTIQFDIPPQTPTLYNSEFATWEAIARYVNTSNFYEAKLSHDTGGTYDNKLEIFYYSNNVQTSITNITYGTALNLSQWWRVLVTVATNINPTVITMSISNITTSTLMTPPIVATNSFSALQAPGGSGLLAYFGVDYYTNVLFQQQYDFAPTIATAPAASTNGTSVSLTWSTPDGGQGGVTNLPQFVVADQYGFPITTTWTNGTLTTSTSQTLTVPASTNVLFRVMSYDAVGQTNYSPWQLVQTASPGSGVMPLLPFRTF